MRAALVLLAGTVLVLAALPATASEGYQREIRVQLHPGVTWEHLSDPGRLALEVAHVAPDAPVRLQPVLADGRFVGPSRPNAPTSAMCADVGGVMCVNGDFWVCPSCGIPGGGVVRDGVPLRSPSELHRQVTLLEDGRLVTEALRISLRLVATFEPEEQEPVEGLVEEPAPGREESLDVHAVNRGRDDGVVLFSPVWAGATPSPEEADSVSFGGAVPPIGAAGPVEIRGRTPPASSIPGDGFVLVATGSAREGFEDRLASMLEADRLELHVEANLPARMSIGGHPVLLRDGEPIPQDPADGKVVNRHPRTLVGWNPEGHRWFVTVDGRQPGRSVGMTLAEATKLLRSLGATDAINLDGGGSSTFVTGVPCTDGRSPCIRNVPSDGRERSVTTALALVPTGGTVVSNTPTPPPPPPTTAPPTTAPPTTAAPTTAPPTTAAPTTAPPTTAPPTTAPPTTMHVVVPTTRDTVPTSESAAPGIDDVGASSAPRPPVSRQGPTAVATIAVLVVGALTIRHWESLARSPRSPAAPGFRAVLGRISRNRPPDRPRTD